MKIREAVGADQQAVREIATASLTTSYGDIFDDEIIDAAVDDWYSQAAFDAYLADDEMEILLAVSDGEPVGFSQSHIVEEIDKGRILWIHVHPEHRGKGVAADLFEATKEHIHARGISQCTAVVLTEHDEGNQFYQSRGFEVIYTRTIEIAGDEQTENIYGEPGTELAELDPVKTAAGKEVYIDRHDTTLGSDAPFAVVYIEPDRTRRYGWFCTNCASLDNAMDSMGRIVCNDCDNRRKPTRWDAAY